MLKLSRSLTLLALLTAFLALACTSDDEGPVGAAGAEATTNTPTAAGATATPLATETETPAPTPTPTQQRNFVGDVGDYPYVVLVEDATADLMENAPHDAVLTFEEVATPSEAVERVEAIDAAGLILDEMTFADFPLAELVPLYDEGRVIVAFEVPLDELQLSLEFGERTASPPGIEMASPFYSLVHQTRPDVQPETGAASSSRFLPELFHSTLAGQADVATGRIRP